MSRIDDYDRHRNRMKRLRRRGTIAGTIYEFCSTCARRSILHLQHFGRAKHDNRAIPICRDCHDHFSDCEQHEHPPLYDDLGDHRERQRRLLLGFIDILEFIASELRLVVGSSTFESGTRIVRRDSKES